jgi:hypothetical protein
MLAKRIIKEKTAKQVLLKNILTKKNKKDKKKRSLKNLL